MDDLIMRSGGWGVGGNSRWLTPGDSKIRNWPEEEALAKKTTKAEIKPDECGGLESWRSSSCQQERVSICGSYEWAWLGKQGQKNNHFQIGVLRELASKRHEEASA